MTLNKEKMLKAELIGLEAEIVDSSNKANIGIKGRISDETRNTLKIENKILLKKDIIIKFEVDGQNILIEGKKLIKSPEERIKIR